MRTDIEWMREKATSVLDAEVRWLTESTNPRPRTDHLQGLVQAYYAVNLITIRQLSDYERFIHTIDRDATQKIRAAALSKLGRAA
ncbi:hypothetical protein [Pseudomonas oryzihabitans]|uniref:hypothetical protein n=1 Tax=Pseudomonas oryzihabitans TaxID=47885 RepID=UPI002895FCE2|nr:hypothetical protein [Pseudomonas oryzihabitans]MDT3718471.1 hypothetical protein [Pseudomonas oryzihabitans]